MIITISDMWKNQQKMLDNDNQIKLSSLIVFLGISSFTPGTDGRLPQADPHLGVAKELLLRSRGRGGGWGVVSWPGRACRAGRAFVCHGCGGAGQAPRGCPGGHPSGLEPASECVPVRPVPESTSRCRTTMNSVIITFIQFTTSEK